MHRVLQEVHKLWRTLIGRWIDFTGMKGLILSNRENAKKIFDKCKSFGTGTQERR